MKNNNLTYIWGIPTRIFHWLLVISLVVAYIVEESNLTLHVALGYMAGILVLFRLVWGLIGPRYSHFRDFPAGIGSQLEFARGFGKTGKVYAGHNPPASVVMLLIMIGVVCVVCTGMLTLAQEGGQGILKSVVLPDYIEFKDIHEASVNVLIALVIFHLAGILIDFILHKSNSALKSIFTGYKSGIDSGDSTMNGFQKLFAFGWIVVPFIAFFLTITGPPVQLNEGEGEGGKTEKNEQGDFGESDEDED